MKVDKNKPLREQFGYLFDSRNLESDWSPDWEDAYIDDRGNVRCGHCDGILVQNITPFYAKLTGKSMDTAIGFVCQCYHDDVARARKREQDDQKKSNIERLKTNSCLSEKFRNVSFMDFDDDVDPTILKARIRMENYAKNCKECLAKGYGVMLAGPKGTGKTLLLACTANALMDSLHTVFFTSFSDILTMIKRSYNDDRAMNEAKIMDLVRDSEFLILDDVGTTEALTGTWEVTKIQEIVNTRYNSHKPLLMSTNMSFAEMVQKGMLAQTADRLSEMCTVRMVLQGNSYRGKERRGKEDRVPF